MCGTAWWRSQRRAVVAWLCCGLAVAQRIAVYDTIWEFPGELGIKIPRFYAVDVSFEY
jgi:hypothetical protein